MEHLRSLGDQRMLLLFFLFCRLPVVSAIEKLLQTVLVCGNPWSSLFLFKFLGISRLLNVGDKLWGAKVKQANCVCVFYCLKANLSEALKPIHMHELGCWHVFPTDVHYTSLLNKWMKAGSAECGAGSSPTNWIRLLNLSNLIQSLLIWEC